MFSSLQPFELLSVFAHMRAYNIIPPSSTCTFIHTSIQEPFDLGTTSIVDIIFEGTMSSYSDSFCHDNVFETFFSQHGYT